MASWLKALRRTRESFTGALKKLVPGKGGLDAESIEDLEEVLLGADVSVRLVQELIDELEAHAGKDESPHHIMRRMLRDALASEDVFDWSTLEKGTCVLMVGINGAGKTTTCAKLARMAHEHGLQPILGAGDTFRAAGTDQLRIWSERVGCDVVAGQQGSDPAAVAYDALDAAMARNKDILFIDTAGRMHTKQPLMNELDKIRRALEKRQPGAPQETWMVLDGSNGQNAISQARVFNEAIPLTGIVITKLDGSSKAGFIFSIKKELNLPIRFVGLGEGAEDLVPFDAEAFVEGLLPVSEHEPAAG